MSIVIEGNKGVASSNTSSQPGHRFISGFAWTTAIFIALCYWNIDHSWSASSNAYLITESYTGDENETVDRMSQVNANSTIFRLVLASWGCLCFVLSPQTRVRVSSPLFWSIVALAIFLSASLFWSSNPSQTLFKLVVLLTMAIAAVGVSCKLSLREFLSVVTLVCVFYIAVGVVAEIWHGYFYPTASYRFIGTTHPNTEAIYASMLCLIARLYLTKDGDKNFFGVALFALGVLVVWYTRSRTTLAGLLISLLIIQVLVVRGSNRLLLILGGMFLAILLVVGSSMISQKSSGALGQFALMGRHDDVSSLSGRLPLWEELLVSINRSPVIGFGYMAYWDAKRVDDLSARFHWVIPHGHNMYLDTLLDGGAIGLILVIAAILSAFSESAFLFLKSRKIEYAIVFGIFAYAVINGFAESLFKLPSFPLFVVATCCFSMIARGSESEEANTAMQLHSQKSVRLSRLKGRQLGR